MRGSICWILVILACGRAGWLPAAVLEIHVVDAAGLRLPCRIHLADAAGAAQKPDNLPGWHDHFVCPGLVELALEPGTYTYEIERGGEYRPATGTVTLAHGNNKTLTVALERIADLAAQGWWSGELHVHRPPADMPMLLRAEDLHVAPVITWWNGRNPWRERPLPADTLVTLDEQRCYDVMGGEDEREGGALMYFGLKEPLPLRGGIKDFPEYPSPMKFVELARAHEGVWIDLEKPFWWDTPVWLASGQIDSIGLANNHMCRDQMYETEAWGKPRDRQRLPAPRGDGFWTQEIYYHVLNCGLRVPPSAGSASGVLPNPVGYNRVYVHLGSEFSYEGWWRGLKAGRSFVTNGPLLVCRANGHLPGHVFHADAALDIEVTANIFSNDHIRAAEIIRNGQVAPQVPLDVPAGSPVRAKLSFERSGWFLVRVIADNPETFRFASTAPYFVEIGSTKARISRRSVQFFLDWLVERRARVPRKLHDPAKLREVLKYHDDAEEFWRQLLSQANAE